MKEILAEVKKGEIHRVMFKNEQLYQYFPRNYTPEQMKNKILEVLEAWQADTSENK
jgi:ParB family chromosome partitioning protein